MGNVHLNPTTLAEVTGEGKELIERLRSATPDTAGELRREVIGLLNRHARAFNTDNIHALRQQILKTAQSDADLATLATGLEDFLDVTRNSGAWLLIATTIVTAMVEMTSNLPGDLLALLGNDEPTPES